jgi:CheY-like chemotaxis protein
MALRLHGAGSMSSQSTLTLVDALAEEAARIGGHAPDDAVRAQAALARAILDEVGRFHPSDRRVAALHEQLGEELSRLAELAQVPVASDVGRRPTLDVLVVDDEPATLSAMAIAVRDNGCSCRTALSADDALSMYAERRADIVISDWNMPGMSGLDLCRLLKSRDPRVYFLLVTAHEDARFLEGVRGCVDDFLPKPVDMDELAIRLGAAGRLLRAVQIVERVRDSIRARSLSLASTTDMT